MFDSLEAVHQLMFAGFMATFTLVIVTTYNTSVSNSNDGQHMALIALNVRMFDRALENMRLRPSIECRSIATTDFGEFRTF